MGSSPVSLTAVLAATRGIATREKEERYVALHPRVREPRPRACPKEFSLVASFRQHSPGGLFYHHALPRCSRFSS